MFPAARIGDPVTHDMVVPSGVIAPPLPGRPMTVMIEGLPAAVVGDFVTCTGATVAGLAHPPQAGPPPAVPPSMPIVLGSFNVFIDGMPAACWISGIAACGVFLGDPKLMSSRTVLIGDIAGGGGGAAGPLAKVIEAYTKGTSASVGSVPPEHAGPLQPKEEEKKKTWLGIVLKDFDGTPIPDQDFQVTLGGGQTLSGRTDAKGYARFENVDQDQGEVAFVNIPEEKEVTAERKKKADAAKARNSASEEGSQETEGQEGAATLASADAQPVADPDPEGEDL
jgi:uncharacterized Zn-binding protein involved in type VI secretion